MIVCTLFPTLFSSKTYSDARESLKTRIPIEKLQFHVENNENLVRAVDCSHKPVALDESKFESPTLYDCVKLCLNEAVTLINVGQDENIFFEDEKLTPNRNYCLLSRTNSSQLHCNPNTSTTLFTINSHICKSKYPNLFGGVSGDQVVACNDKSINDIRNILWDNMYNQQVSASVVNLSDENEIITESSRDHFRFTCHFNGVDEMGNHYTAHPINRFKPIRNWCAAKVFHASSYVKTVFIYNDSNLLIDYKCDCGDPAITRLENLDSDDTHSQCIPHSHQTVTEIGKNAKQLNYTYNCFTIDSPIISVTQNLPCNADIFLDPPNPSPLQTQSLQMSFSNHITNAYIEHPDYQKFSADESVTFINKVKNNVTLFD